MKTKKKAVIGALVAGLVLVIPAAAFAQVVDKGVYFGASTGKARYDRTCKNITVPCEDTPFAWKVLAGYQFSRNLSAEFGYSDLGKAKGEGTSGGATTNFGRTVTAWELSLLGGPSFGEHFKAYGRFGFLRAETKLTGAISGAAVDVSEKSGSFTYGVGAQYDFNRNVGLRGEWQRYAQTGGGKIKPFLPSADKDNIDMYSVGLIVKY